MTGTHITVPLTISIPSWALFTNGGSNDSKRTGRMAKTSDRHLTHKRRQERRSNDRHPYNISADNFDSFLGRFHQWRIE
jgi:hypothetical protein